MPTILLKFAGPLQSWGTSSHFEDRHTDYYPSKSAVMGMLAACLGYQRDEQQQLQRLQQLDFALRIDQQGSLLKDYQIASKYASDGKFEKTYVTNRYYLSDAVFVVALAHEQESFIQELVDGLRQPWFQPFMGRRSAPVNTDYLLAVSNEPILKSLQNCPWQAALWWQKECSTSATVNLEIYADAHLLSSLPSHLRRDKVLSFSFKQRKFAYRLEAKSRVTIANQHAGKNIAEHDVWQSMGGEHVSN